jgi:hypothetical protein
LGEALEDTRKNGYHPMVRSLLGSAYCAPDDYVDREIYLWPGLGVSTLPLQVLVHF